MGKHITIEIPIENCQVKVVDNFKLRGVKIDNKLNFDKYSRDLRLSINKKLYIIKRLFYLYCGKNTIFQDICTALFWLLSFASNLLSENNNTTY